MTEKDARPAGMQFRQARNGGKIDKHRRKRKPESQYHLFLAGP
jgi:hypothetical protein